MAKVTFNETFNKMSGKVGRLVFRQQNGQTILVPLGENEAKPSGAQVARRSRFGEAQAYAKRVLADPMQWEHYRLLGRERNCPPNALLVANFLNPPVIDSVGLAEFTGRAGDRVRILASDAIEVVSVNVVARGADAQEIEGGAAIKEHGIWNYRCTTALAGNVANFDVTAVNRAGAKATQTIALG